VFETANPYDGLVGFWPGLAPDVELRLVATGRAGSGVACRLGVLVMGHLPIVIGLVAVALAFDYINGFHDAANSIATVVSTRVLSPGKAVIWAAFFNFVAAFGFGTAVARTVGSGMIDIRQVTFGVILAGLLGAIIWDLITWYFGLPTSSSHALIGGYAGAAVTKAGVAVIIPSGWTKTLVFIVASPLIGLAAGLIVMVAIYWIFARTTPARIDRWFRRLQLVSAALFSLNHGANDAQKTMGIIAGVLFTAGYLQGPFVIPFWVVLMAHAAIGLGTLSGGWRIIHTMGSRITKLQPVNGFAAETGAATAILIATHFGIPVSTTHAITGAIVGVGATRRLSAVRWGLAGQIVWAWILTIPAAALIGAATYLLLKALGVA
jgi:inorganic phosphate transporter, PiT family